MVRIAIPIYNNRVSPVLDSCTRLLIIDVERNTEVGRRELFLENFPLHERFDQMKKAAIDVVICCAISDVLDGMLQATDIQLLCGIVGDVDQVLEAFFCNKLDDSYFRMPGYIEKR
ncbi:MAG: hypothetical protein HGJ94_20555 [Desulfosarcina sp.]|nr:hypothetical protein [Desulfosarcina sp.]MBC2742244.1 hypothetical protein [Desulfosarcina sp.]MBC2765156.1 hypothetical protein [Desulfosarcina sp.]